MSPHDLYTVIGSSVGSVVLVGMILAVPILRATSRIDADHRTFQTEAAADRRAFQKSMDDFRKEMQRLAERQSRLERVPGS